MKEGRKEEKNEWKKGGMEEGRKEGRKEGREEGRKKEGRNITTQKIIGLSNFDDGFTNRFFFSNCPKDNFPCCLPHSFTR